MRPSRDRQFHPYDLLGHIEDAIQIGADYSVPVGFGHSLESHVARNTRVVDPYVDRRGFS
jgi:hypothetical protein